MENGEYYDSDDEDNKRDRDGDFTMTGDDNTEKREEKIAKKVIEKLAPKKGEDALKELAKNLRQKEEEFLENVCRLHGCILYCIEDVNNLNQRLIIMDGVYFNFAQCLFRKPET